MWYTALVQTQPHNSLEFVFLYGKAGAGKDTQAGLLCGNSPSALIISTGDIVRAAKTT